MHEAVDAAAALLCVLAQSAGCLPLLSTVGPSLLLLPLQAARAKSIATAAEILIRLYRIESILLSVAGYAALVVGPAVAAVATGRVKLAFYLVKCHEIPAVRHLPVRTVTVNCGGLHLHLIGMAVSAE